MYEVYQVSDDLFQVHSTFAIRAMEGSRLAILVYMTSELGFKPEELQEALLDMLDKGHDSAHFGMNRTFIHSFNYSTKYGKKVS
jgi:hypothetical protein